MNAAAGSVNRPTSPDARVRARALTWLRHLSCVLALMWTGLVNGQPFMFQSDTTNYVRAADAALFVVSGGAMHTAWTDRYRAQLNAKAAKSAQAATRPSTSKAAPAGANDLSAGLIMGGRSPYIGALMYAGYLLGDFWPFVLFQAVVAYLLIILTLRRFDVYRPLHATALVFVLAATTALPTYNSLLLADGVASFGILAYLLLASPGKLSRLEQAFLGVTLLIAVTAHLTHIMMLIGMVAALGLLALVRVRPQPPRRAWVTGIGGILLGFASVQATSFATKLAFGNEPQLLPLMSARFIADGPGWHYIRSGCDGRKFVMCRIPIAEPRSDSLILFGRTPQDGAYMLATPEERRKMGEEDVAFALAVLRYDFTGQLAAMARNTVRQLTYIDYDGLNQNCFARPNCWRALPESQREKLRRTPSGQGLWPERFMNGLLYTVVLGSVAILAVLGPSIARQDPERWRLLRTWLLVGFAAMFVCAFFGGAVAEPQYRYQGRLIWLVPFMAGVSLLIHLQLKQRYAANPT